MNGVFREIDNEGSAYWLGFMLADGCVSTIRGTQPYVSVSQKDPVHLHKMCDFVGGGIPRESRNKNGSTWYKVVWYDKESYNDLVRWNCVPAKSKILQPPVGLPDDMIRHVIRGYNDGDGGVYPASRGIRMRGTEAFLLWVQAHLPHKSSVYPKGPTAQLWSRGQNAVNNARWLYEDAEHFMDRKRDAARELYGD